MISPVQAVNYACNDVYNPITPNVFTTVLHIGVDYIGLIELPDTIIIVPAGSESLPMWEENAEIYPTYNNVLGYMHSGFFDPAKQIYDVVSVLSKDKEIILAGHSRGAAIAGCLAALFLTYDVKVSQLFVFECPRFGFQQSADYFAKQISDGNLEYVLSTINGLDVVPDVPTEPYVAPFITTQLDTAPGGVKDADPIEWHLGKVIIEGVTKMFGNA